MKYNSLRLDPATIFSAVSQNQELKGKVVHGGTALLVSQAGSFGLSLVNTAVLARLLTPSDFGVIGMVTVVINFVSMFREAGLSTATIQKDKIESGQISTLFWINVLISITLGLIIVGLSPLVGLFYNKPELKAVTAALSVSFILQGLIVQHHALLHRHLKFTTMAVNDLVAQAVMIVVAALMAFLGFHYWALVGGTIARSLMLVSLTYFSCPWRPHKMRKGTGIRNMLLFGGHLTVSYFIGYLAKNLDKLLIGKFVGEGPLGLYTRAYTILMHPLTQVRAPLTSLSLPVLSTLRTQPERYRNYFNKLLDISISLSLPIAVYCFIESEFVIRIVLGPKWLDAVPVFRILSVAGMFVAVSVSPGLVMLSHGYSRRYMRLTVLNAIITTLAFIVGINFGVNGVAMAYTASSFLIMIPLILFAFKDTPIPLRLVFLIIAKPAIAAAVAGSVAYFLTTLIDAETIAFHIMVFLVFLLLYSLMTFRRSNTRNTIKEIFKSLTTGKR